MQTRKASNAWPFKPSLTPRRYSELPSAARRIHRGVHRTDSRNPAGAEEEVKLEEVIELGRTLCDRLVGGRGGPILEHGRQVSLKVGLKPA